MPGAAGSACVTGCLVGALAFLAGRNRNLAPKAWQTLAIRCRPCLARRPVTPRSGKSCRVRPGGRGSADSSSYVGMNRVKFAGSVWSSQRPLTTARTHPGAAGSIPLPRGGVFLRRSVYDLVMTGRGDRIAVSRRSNVHALVAPRLPPCCHCDIMLRAGTAGRRPDLQAAALRPERRSESARRDSRRRCNPRLRSQTRTIARSPSCSPQNPSGYKWSRS